MSTNILVAIRSLVATSFIFMRNDAVNKKALPKENNFGVMIQGVASVFFFLGLGISFFLSFAFGLERDLTKLEFHAESFFFILFSGIFFTILLSLFFHRLGKLITEATAL